MTLILIFTVTFICFGIDTETLYAKESNIIKVGYPIVSGFTEKNDGIYSGYAYDYLREIAIYTGWEYEFVEMDLATAMAALRNGEIDIAAGMLKNEQTMELFDFPKYGAGHTYTTLATLKDNEKFNGTGYIVLDHINIGYFETAKASLDNFMDFFKANNFEDISLTAYPNQKGLLTEKLKSKEVDAILTGDLLIDQDLKVLARFGPNPYYFATTKGNTDIIKGLNHALSKIQTKDPDFEQDLYNKYFQNSNDYNLILTQKEVDYIKNMKPLKAIYIDNYIPIQYYDSSTKQAKGIFVDIIRLVSRKTSIPFEFVSAKDYKEAYQMLKDKKGDLLIGALDDYAVADQHDFLLTKHYLKLDLTKAINRNLMQQGGKTIIALPKGHGPIDLSDEYEMGAYEIVYYDTLEDCLIAVNEGTATVTYGNNYSMINYTAQGYYSNLRVLSDTHETRIAIGLSKSLDEQLIDIIHKAVYTLSDQEITNIVNNNSLSIRHKLSLKALFFNNVELSLSVIAIILGLIGTIIFIVIKTRFDKIEEAKTILFEKTRIDSLTGVNNREACEQLVTEYIQTKDLSLYATFIIMDIDYFKQINDRFGHKKGDKLLIEFSSLLKQFFSPIDIVSRLGGDEFIVFMKDIDEKDIGKIHKKLQELCEIMDKEIVYNDCSQKISLSVGAVVTQQPIKFSKFYSMADEILYEVKRNGRNGFKIKKL